MINKVTISILFVLVFTCMYSQQDSTTKLEEVFISDYRLKNELNKTLSIKINDSILKNFNESFTDLFRQQSSVYFKENGNGMVSSPSFRGTNASQTAVIWNGININSQTTGQTDFNNVGLGGINDITVKSGGGSNFYGSGAIGGSIHLEHNFTFNKKETFSLGSSIGSYDNFIQRGNVTIANTNYYVNGFIKHQDSDNDYPFLGTDLINENGQFENFSIGLNTAYKISQKDVLKLYFSYLTNNRNLSRTLFVSNKSRLEDITNRLLLAWNRKEENTNFNLRLARLHEEYKYFENRLKKDLFSGSEVSNYTGNADVDFKIDTKLNIKLAVDGNLIFAEGDNITKKNRRNIAGITSLSFTPTKKLNFTITGRKEYTNTYKVPVIGSLDVNYEIIDWYTIGINGSKNYRIPTFNDLYWVGQGNPDLVPETSYQANFNHFFRHKNNSLQIAGFYIDTNDMIKWAPGNGGVWLPDNIAHVINYGVEANLKTSFKYRKHNINISGNYVYVKSIDQETDKQLIYVPIHKASGTISYNLKKLTIFYENIFTDDVFTNGVNTKNLLDYNISNIGANYNFKIQKHILGISAKLNNLLNKEYEVVRTRPMPNRNILISLNYKYN